MSYDLQVYAARWLSMSELVDVVTSARLGVATQEPDASSLTVTRGAKNGYSFTLGLPLAVEMEDVPDEVTAHVLAPSCLYEVLVEGSSTPEIPHAIRFARRLADVSDGAVLDQQLGEVWSRGKLRQVLPVSAGRISIVDVRWYARRAGNPESVAEAWLALAGRYLPEALPRRYGSFEPLQERFNGNASAFTTFVREAAGTVFFSAERPAISGSLAGGSPHDGPVESHGLTLFAEPLIDPRWRESLHRLFVEFASQTDSILATAEVNRGVRWSGRSIGYDGQSESGAYLAPRGMWLGLPPYPVWWSYFGAEYTPLVRDHFAPAGVEVVREGALFHSSSSEPLDRDQLLTKLGPSKGGLRRIVPGTSKTPPSWVPTELQAAREEQSVGNMRIPRLVVAPVRPVSLR